MKLKISIKHALSIIVMLMLLASCSSPNGLVFANREWHISEHYGQIIDKDTTYRMTFGNVLIPNPLTIVSSSDSAAKYPGMDKFLSDILHKSHLDSAEILFYAPHMHTMFVKPNGNMPPMRPSSISSPMPDKKPYTMWLNEDDIEDWTRKSTEMYTYTYFDKRKKQLLIVDLYDYGDTPIAQVTIFQSRNKTTSKMNVQATLRRAFFETHDLRKYMQDIEFWANNVEARRARAFANYKIGQEQAKRIFNGEQTIAQADSAMMAGSPKIALEFYRKYLKYGEHPGKSILFNAACAASLSGEIDYGIDLLKTIASQDSTWYYKEPLDKDLYNLQESEDWIQFNRMIAERRANAEKNYNIPLRMRLTQIRRADQDVRHRFLNAYKSQPQDTLLVKALIDEMQRIDTNNIIEIDSILNEYGWPGREIVGDECSTIWLVLQHSDLETQVKALPMLKTAASRGDISPVAIAMLEDRILVNSGKKQLYGTQFFYSDDKKSRIIYPIEDIDNVDKRRDTVGLRPLKEDYSDGEVKTIYLNNK